MIKKGLVIVNTGKGKGKQRQQWACSCAPGGRVFKYVCFSSLRPERPIRVKRELSSSMKSSKQQTRGRWALEARTSVLVALGLDMLGEPPASWHPAAWYGKCIQRLEQAAPQNHLAQETAW